MPQVLEQPAVTSVYSSHPPAETNHNQQLEHSVAKCNTSTTARHSDYAILWCSPCSAVETAEPISIETAANKQISRNWLSVNSLLMIHRKVRRGLSHLQAWRKVMAA